MEAIKRCDRCGATIWKIDTFADCWVCPDCDNHIPIKKEEEDEMV